MSFIAPAGTRLGVFDVLSMMTGGALSGAAQRRLIERLENLTGASAFAYSSGRAAMTCALKAMRKMRGDDSRNEVIIPAYTCYSVPAAVERAGLRPRLCDISATTLGMDVARLERFDFSRALAIVSSNLYGMPNELARIEDIARKHGIFMLDDAAQALGASVGGRLAGAFGDVGLFSFDKGKIISTIQGGALIVRPGPLRDHIAGSAESLPEPAFTETAAMLIKTMIYAVCLRPSIYELVRRLPFLGLGRTPYETVYPTTRLSSPQANLARRLLAHLDGNLAARRRIAAQYAEALADLACVRRISVERDSQPAYARFPVLMADEERRDEAVRLLNDAGIGASASYPNALADVPEVVAQLPAADLDTPAARTVAASIMTLPTHAYCPADIGRRVSDVLSALLDSRAAGAPQTAP